MSMFSKSIMILLLAFFIALWKSPYAVSTRDQAGENFFYIPATKTHVIVTNYLEDSNFTIHCKSGDDDLGTHVIASHDYYSWKFRVNVVKTTLFFCAVSWRDGRMVNDFYKAFRDLDRCQEYCNWRVERDGVFGYNDKGKRDIVFKWSKLNN